MDMTYTYKCTHAQCRKFC